MYELTNKDRIIFIAQKLWGWEHKNLPSITVFYKDSQLVGKRNGIFQPDIKSEDRDMLVDAMLDNGWIRGVTEIETDEHYVRFSQRGYEYEGFATTRGEAVIKAAYRALNE